MLGDEGSGLVETYVVRTTLAAVVCMALFPPRDVARNDIPRLLVRSVVVTTYFVFVIVGAQTGSPVVVQTMVATTPLFVLAAESVRRGTAPPARAVVAAGIVIAGVSLILLT
jgi:drug/metabolite transporter (DMT)-like permease